MSVGNQLIANFVSVIHSHFLYTAWPLKKRQTDCPKTAVTNYQSMLRNNPGKWRYQILWKLLMEVWNALNWQGTETNKLSFCCGQWNFDCHRIYKIQACIKVLTLCTFQLSSVSYTINNNAAVWFLVNDQLDVSYFLCIYFNSVHVSRNLVLIIRRINFINTTSGTCHSLSVTVSCAGRKETLRPAHETVIGTGWHIPDVLLIKLILLMMSMKLLETCRELK
jgi:hypothetical protein